MSQTLSVSVTRKAIVVREGCISREWTVSSSRLNNQQSKFRICFVCTGNICRSPMAESVMRSMLQRAGLAERAQVSSRGTGDWHVGEQADSRSLSALRERGFDGSRHRARQFDLEDFTAHDLIVALDQSHVRVLHELAPSEEEQAKIELLLSFVPGYTGELDVFDPYYSDQDAFGQVLENIERACAALIQQLEPALRHGDTS